MDRHEFSDVSIGTIPYINRLLFKELHYTEMYSINISCSDQSNSILKEK